MLGLDRQPITRYSSLSTGLRTEFGTFTPPGGRVVAYVHSSGPAALPGDLGAPQSPTVYTTLNAALRQCASGKGDTVIVLPGHAENISTADQMSNLVAGTRIIGCGSGNLRPTFTWTAAAATFLLDVANVRLENLILNMDPGAGTVNVAAPITISAAGCQLVNLKIRMGTDANSTVTIGITTTAAADDLEIISCDIYGAVASVITTGIRFVGADRLRMLGVRINVGTSADAVGAVQFLTTASTGILIEECAFMNLRATATAGFTGMAGLTGLIQSCFAGIGGTGGPGATEGFVTMGSLNIGSDMFVNDQSGTTAAEAFPTA